MLLPTNMFILVADGRKMLLLRNSGTADAPQLTVEYGEEQPNPPDHVQKTDLSGRRPATGTQGQASVTEADYHQQTEDRFAIRAAEELNGRALRHEYDALIVVAPPRTLGELRSHYHKTVRNRLVAEIAKDLTGYSTDRIVQMLTNA
jgi:protein required for attachment to host cells